MDGKGLVVKVSKVHPDALLPRKGSLGAACWDVHSLEDCLVSHEIVQSIRTGLAFEIPYGYELEIRPRSGLSKSLQVANSPGTLDSDYRGELLILVIARSGLVSVKKGDRIAQVKVNKVEQVSWELSDTLSETERGANGFGSTGR